MRPTGACQHGRHDVKLPPTETTSVYGEQNTPACLSVKRFNFMDFLPVRSAHGTKRSTNTGVRSVSAPRNGDQTFYSMTFDAMVVSMLSGDIVCFWLYLGNLTYPIANVSLTVSARLSHPRLTNLLALSARVTVLFSSGSSRVAKAFDRFH